MSQDCRNGANLSLARKISYVLRPVWCRTLSPIQKSQAGKNISMFKLDNSEILKMRMSNVLLFFDRLQAAFALIHFFLILFPGGL